MLSSECASLLESIGDYAIINLDNAGKITWCNKATTTMTGFTAAEITGQSFTIFYTAEDRRLERCLLELEQADKKNFLHVEGWRVGKDEKKFWANVSINVLTNEAGRRHGYICLIEDISEKKQSELKTYKENTQFRIMVESVKDYGIFMLDENGYIVSWNEGAKEIKGYSAHEIIGKHFSVFYTKDDIDNGKPPMELETAARTGKYEEEGWRVRKDGSVFWANVVITALFNEFNELIGFSKVTRDLTQKKESDTLLRESEERYRYLIEQVRDYGIFMLDEKGRIVSWNEGAKKIEGYTAKEIIGKYFSIFYTEEDKINNKPAKELEIASKTGKYEEENWRVRKDGSLFWANVVITAIYNLQGMLIGYSKVTRDLTEKKEAEMHLKESFRQYKLLAEQLHTTNERLEITNKEMEQFTSIVSHDLQEPVRTIRSFLNILIKNISEKEKDSRLYISKALAATEWMKELIQNLLHYSQYSLQPLKREHLQVPDMVNEALQNLKNAIEDADAQIDIDLEVTEITGDRVQVVQLVQNLVGNAIKFNSNTLPKVKISNRITGNEVTFAIADNGIGINESDRKKIFEIFRRLHKPKDYPGTGIGLSICKKIIDRHNGKIWVDSKTGFGTTFYFTLGTDK